MSLSAKYCSDNTGDRGGGGGALAHQRKMIRGLLVWATLLTLGLAVSITLHFIERKPPVPEKLQNQRIPTQQPKDMDMNLITFTPNYFFTGEGRDMVEKLQWNTVSPSGFIEGDEELRVKDDGRYFLYLQVTLNPQMAENYTITVNSSTRKTILEGLINKPKLSTGFMGVGISMNRGETLTVICKPKAKISDTPIETYLGVIKLH
ncbi:tumor necrosis factor ligand superfamily member 18 isoform X2 [Chanodichthys erythropterus]|uniref:tumor necrosis factor ligand superfamily member 18 isoform X2 n=1 Tax=Chanodichthys erythropterus TaxID=933992 RepID=UPI00351DFC05